MWAGLALLLVLLARVDSFRPLQGGRAVAGRVSMAKDYAVRVINKKKNYDNTLRVPSNAYILDSFEQQGSTAIPYSCRAGSCSSCLGKLMSGTVDQSSQIFLDDDKIDMGYILTCAAYVTSDAVVEVDVEEDYYNLVRAEGGP